MEIKKHKKSGLSTRNAEDKIKFSFSKNILNLFIGYAIRPDVSKMHLNNLYKLLDITDERAYEMDVELYSRLALAKNILQARCKDGLDKKDVIISYCSKNNDSTTNRLLAEIDELASLSENEINFIHNAVKDRLQYSFLVYFKEIIINEFMRLDTGDYKSYKEIVESVKEKCGNLMNYIRKADISDSNMVFSLRPEVFDQLVMETVEAESNPSAALLTGVEMLNKMLSPGYLQGRLYIWLGVTAGFKSCMLLLTCYWIKKYNRVNTASGKIPTVLYITTENGIMESIVRLWNMTSSHSDITNYEPKEVVRIMREKGGLTLETGETDIVMQYYGNLEISTSDLYGIIDDLEDDNREVICLVHDYIKRIRPATPAKDEREQLAHVSNEFKDLAVKLRIPVITAQQINRAGNVVIDAAMESGKEDLARFLGRGNIAQCWDMLENADWAGILNIEVERTSKTRYLTIKEIKKRYKSMTNIDYFNQPFVEGSTIQLVEDIGSDKPAGKLSLATDLIGVKVEDITATRGKQNAKKREEINGDKKPKKDFSNAFDFSAKLGKD